MNPTYTITFSESNSPGYGLKSATYEVPLETYLVLQRVLTGQAKVADDPPAEVSE